MTSPIEQIEIRCPKCGTDYKDWYRASINLMLDDLNEEYLPRRGLICASMAGAAAWIHVLR